jgi:hypothetical protein
VLGHAQTERMFSGLVRRDRGSEPGNPTERVTDEASGKGAGRIEIAGSRRPDRRGPSVGSVMAIPNCSPRRGKVRDRRNAMTYAKDPRIDAFIDALPPWQQAICQEVRDLVHAADPEVVETIKRTTQPYFVLDGNICALLAAKDHVNVFLYDGAIVPDPEGIITAGHDNQTARTVSFRAGERINARALTAMLRQIIANNRAGGWRRIKAAG